MGVAELVQHAMRCFAFQSPGAFYGAAEGRSPGPGLVYRGVMFPLFNADTRTFDTAEGIVYVFTHECDITEENERIFNELAVVCPIIPFEDFVTEYGGSIGHDRLPNLIASIASDQVYRVFFLPPHLDELKHGALLYLNQICSTQADTLRTAEPVCALSTYALARLDYKLQNHFLRPKSEQLPQLT